MELLHHMYNTVVFGKNLVKVCEIYGKFVQALEPMGELQKTNSIVCLFVDKLPRIRAELVINDDNRQEWHFQRLV